MAQRPLGVDVSNHQGSGINWGSVKGGGFSFAWAKATEGINFIDADFTLNEANAKSAGVLIGGYHFAHPDVNTGTAGADSEASYFLNEAGGYIQSGGSYLVPMLDFETSAGTGTSMSTWVNEWCQDIVNYGTANALNVKPVVYTDGSIASSLNSTVTQWPLWMASPNGQNPQTGAPNSTGIWPTWTIWQYGSFTTPGITTGVVDQDVYNGTAAGFSAQFVITSSSAAPSFTTQPQSTTATLGSNVTFTAAASGVPAPTYQWKFNHTNIPSATSTSYTITHVQTNNAGTYSVVASNSLGTATSSNATLTVYIPLTFTLQPTNTIAFLGSNVTFAATGIGTPPPTYQWQFNSVDIPSATNSSFSFSNAQSNQQGNFQVTISNTSGSIISSNATLTIVTRPSITAQPTNATVNQGNTTNFTVTAAGTPTLYYQWQLGGSNVAGATNSIYTISNAQPAQAGNYQVIITNNYGSVTSAVRTLTVHSPPAITNQPQSLTVPAGSNATFTVTATGTLITYQWRFNTVPIGGATGSTYTVTNAQATNAGNYSVVVTNAFGSVTSSNAVLTVLTPPPQFISVTVLSNGEVQMVLNGQTGSSYAIDSSSNLVDWVQLTTFTNSSGTYQFTDTSSTNHPLGFYRARLLP